MPYTLSRFGFNDMMDCRSRIRSLFEDEPESLSAAAQRAVEFFHGELVDDEGRPACALVRLFKTHPYGDLPPELQEVARRAAAPEVPAAASRCLILLGTRGQEEAWSFPERSAGHRAIPLLSVEMVEKAPMISQLITQMGLEIATVVRPDRALLLERNDATYNVFHVGRALGSPHIVAQEEFVERYGIASVLGFGGLLSSGDLFAVIMFTKVPVLPDVADQFRVLGLNLKIAILPFARKPLFPLL
jgi:hypothetical protein